MEGTSVWTMGCMREALDRVDQRIREVPVRWTVHLGGQLREEDGAGHELGHDNEDELCAVHLIQT